MRISMSASDMKPPMGACSIVPVSCFGKPGLPTQRQARNAPALPAERLLERDRRPWPTSDSGRAEMPPTLLTRNRQRVALCPATSEVGKSRSLTGASTPDVARARRMPFDKVRRAFAFSQPRDPRPRPASDNRAGRTRVCGLASSSGGALHRFGRGAFSRVRTKMRPNPSSGDRLVLPVSAMSLVFFCFW